MQTVEGRERMCRLGFTSEVVGDEREDDSEERQKQPEDPSWGAEELVTCI